MSTLTSADRKDQLKAAAEHYAEDKLPAAIEALSTEWENKQWNAE